jgi:branched-chain amino acid transport system permease protein
LRSGSLATEVLVFALAALGCNLLLGFTGLLSFGQGIFFGLGSYTAGLVLTKLDGAAGPAGVAGGDRRRCSGAALVGWFSIRQRGTYFVMLTLAFGQMFYFLAYTTPDLTGGDNGLLDIPRPALSLFGKTLVPLTTPWQYYGFVACSFCSRSGCSCACRIPSSAARCWRFATTKRAPPRWATTSSASS